MELKDELVREEKLMTEVAKVGLYTTLVIQSEKWHLRKKLYIYVHIYVYMYI